MEKRRSKSGRKRRIEQYDHTDKRRVNNPPVAARRQVAPVIAPGQINPSIVVVRGCKVLLDEQPATFYGVPARALVRAVKRNIDRCPDDFAFQLSPTERVVGRCVSWVL